MNIRTYIRMCIHTYVCMYVYTYVRIYVCIYVSFVSYVCINVCVCVCVYIIAPTRVAASHHKWESGQRWRVRGKDLSLPFPGARAHQSSKPASSPPPHDLSARRSASLWRAPDPALCARTATPTSRTRLLPLRQAMCVCVCVCLCVRVCMNECVSVCVFVCL
jgi:hypothetical protein